MCPASLYSQEHAGRSFGTSMMFLNHCSLPLPPASKEHGWCLRLWHFFLFARQEWCQKQNSHRPKNGETCWNHTSHVAFLNFWKRCSRCLAQVKSIYCFPQIYGSSVRYEWCQKQNSHRPRNGKTCILEPHTRLTSCFWISASAVPVASHKYRAHILSRRFGTVLGARHEWCQKQKSHRPRNGETCMLEPQSHVAFLNFCNFPLPRASKEHRLFSACRFGLLTPLL